MALVVGKEGWACADLRLELKSLACLSPYQSKVTRGPLGQWSSLRGTWAEVLQVPLTPCSGEQEPSPRNVCTEGCVTSPRHVVFH